MFAVSNAPHTPEGIEIKETDDPEPDDNEAVVRLGASSLNRGETVLLATRPAGWRPGQDVAGVVDRPAADGSGPDAGERVVGRVEGEGWAEYAAVPTNRLAVLPDQVALDAAATLPIAGLTALRVLRLGGNLLGKRVLITGASGAVGRFQIQLAVAQGAHVTAVAAIEHANGLHALGADHVIQSVGDGVGSYDLVSESIGGTVLADAIANTAPGATVVTIGATSGERTPIWQNDFFGHENIVIRPFMSYASADPDGDDLDTLISLLADGSLDASIGLRVTWRNAHEGLQALKDRQVHGKVVFTFGDD